MTPEAKSRRKSKIQKLYATGIHDDLWKRYSIERRGAKNPNAKPVQIDDNFYETIAAAEKATGIKGYTITRRALSPKHPSYKFL
jgi:hypothetical protein